MSLDPKGEMVFGLLFSSVSGIDGLSIPATDQNRFSLWPQDAFNLICPWQPTSSYVIWLPSAQLPLPSAQL
jgi:hypothetical protein